MKNFKTAYARLFFPCLLAAILLLSGFKILDRASTPVYSLLPAIANELEAIGIDVMQDWRSNVSTEDRPVLAPLANYNSKWRSESNPALFKNEWVREFHRWLYDFNYNDVGYALAAPTGKAPFRSLWNNASPDQRIFLSFAGEDNEKVQEVKRVLEGHGYKVFTYLSDTEMELSGEQIAYYMTTAGCRVVFDTKAARQKVGVNAETLAEALYPFQPQVLLKLRNDERLETLASSVQLPNFDSVFSKVKVDYPNMSDQQIESMIESDFRYTRNSTRAQIQSEYKNTIRRSVQQRPGSYAYEVALSQTITVIDENPLGAICTAYGIPAAMCPQCSISLKSN